AIEETMSAEQESDATEVIDNVEDREGFPSEIEIDDEVEEGILDSEEAEEMIELAEDEADHKEY
ncbi:MAG: transcription termination/antitermination protein NusA, partial [Carnobacterium sp.]